MNAKAIAVDLYRSRIVQQVLDGPEQQRQRRPKLMADIGKEERLGPVDLRKRLGTASLHLQAVDIGKTGRQLISHQRTVIQVTLVGQPMGIEPHDQKTRRFFRARPQKSLLTRPSP